MPGIDTRPNQLTVAKSENQRLQNELDDMKRRFQGLDTRNYFLILFSCFKINIYSIRYKKIRTRFTNN